MSDPNYDIGGGGDDVPGDYFTDVLNENPNEFRGYTPHHICPNCKIGVLSGPHPFLSLRQLEVMLGQTVASGDGKESDFLFCSYCGLTIERSGDIYVKWDYNGEYYQNMNPDGTQDDPWWDDDDSEPPPEGGKGNDDDKDSGFQKMIDMIMNMLPLMMMMPMLSGLGGGGGIGGLFGGKKDDGDVEVNVYIEDDDDEQDWI
jgi:hypothetical protein